MLGGGLALVLIGALSFLLPLFGRQFILVKILGLTGMGSSIAGLVFIGVGIILIKVAIKTGSQESAKAHQTQPIPAQLPATKRDSPRSENFNDDVITEKVFAAADAGDIDMQFLVGSTYLSGANGLPKNPGRAFHYISKAAIDGHGLAAYALSSLYADGLGVAQNFDSARVWAVRAKGRGILDADKMLAIIDAKRRE